jgi:hypothetical protein
MTNNAPTATHAATRPTAMHQITRQLSPRLLAYAAGFTAVGVATGVVAYLNRSSVREAHVSGTSAWPQQLIVAAVACALYVVARWRRSRRPDHDGRRLLLLAPLGRSAAARLSAAMRHRSWRTIAALPPTFLIAYSFWRAGEQIIGGLDPNFTANAWGGPSYLGAMACHYLDLALVIAACAWLLNRILPRR